MVTSDSTGQFAGLSEEKLLSIFEETDYISNEKIRTTVLLSLRLNKPLLVEGAPGSGKTELGNVLAKGFDTDLIRLQCYEGLDVENALYEWKYTKQLLAVQADEARAVDEEQNVFGEEYLSERPLLRALTHEGDRPPVLLIDEVDRADEAFEAFLLEFLADFQMTIPEIGTVEANRPPIVVITSNRTRGLSDALKRRCLYLHIDPPSFEKEYDIVRHKVPELDAVVASEVCGLVQRLRDEPLLKQPGVAETLDWARAIAELRTDDASSISTAEIENTLSCLLKEIEDVQRIDRELLEALRDAAHEARLNEK